MRKKFICKSQKIIARRDIGTKIGIFDSQFSTFLPRNLINFMTRQKSIFTITWCYKKYNTVLVNRACQLVNTLSNWNGLESAVIVWTWRGTVNKFKDKQTNYGHQNFERNLNKFILSVLTDLQKIWVHSSFCDKTCFWLNQHFEKDMKTIIFLIIYYILI